MSNVLGDKVRELESYLGAEYAWIDKDLNDLQKVMEGCTDSGEMVTIAKRLTRLHQRVEEIHAAEKAVPLATGRVVDRVFKTRLEVIKRLKEAMLEKIGTRLEEMGELSITNDYGITASVSKPWTFDVVDLSLVPREYITIDAPAVRKAIKAGARDIPGLFIYQERKVVAR